MNLRFDDLKNMYVSLVEVSKIRKNPQTSFYESNFTQNLKKYKNKVNHRKVFLTGLSLTLSHI